MSVYEDAAVYFNGVPYLMGNDFSCEFEFSDDRAEFHSHPKPESYECSVEMNVQPREWKRMLRLMPPMRCRKCAGEGTRGHHRKCVKRGACHYGRERHATRIEWAAKTVWIGVKVRRGRRGVGLSIGQALRHVERCGWPRVRGTTAHLSEQAKLAGLGAGPMVTTDASGHVTVTPSGRRPMWLLERAQRELQRHAPAWVMLRVEQGGAHG